MTPDLDSILRCDRAKLQAGRTFVIQRKVLGTVSDPPLCREFVDVLTSLRSTSRSEGRCSLRIQVGTDSDSVSAPDACLGGTPRLLLGVARSHAPSACRRSRNSVAGTYGTIKLRAEEMRGENPEGRG